MKKTLPTLCAGLLMLIFVFGLTTNFAKAASAPTLASGAFTLTEITNKLISAKIIDPNSRLNVNQIISKLFAAKMISSDAATEAKVRALFEVSTTPPTATFSIPSQGVLSLKYNSLGKESTLSGKHTVNVTAGTQDVLIYKFYSNFKSTKYSGTTKNSVHSFSGTKNTTKEVFKDSNGKSFEVWRVKAGKTAKFETSISSPSKELFAGTYTAILTSAIQIYGDGIENHMGSMPTSSSNSVAIVGEGAGTTSSAQVSALPNSIESNIKPGQEGQQVTLLQQALKQIGLYSGEITGFFGNLTKKSVTEFQTANALDAVGEVGPKTRELLNRILGQ